MKQSLLSPKKIILAGFSLLAFGFSQSQNINTIAGTGISGFSGDGGAATSAKLFNPAGLAMDASGNVYIADYSNNCIRMLTISSGKISTVAGIGGIANAGYSGDGAAATSAELNNPTSIALDAAGNIYIADYGNSVIRKVTKSTGNISTIAGNSTPGYSGDSGPATSAELNGPHGVAVTVTGDTLYIADFNNSRVRAVVSGFIVTIAGNSTAGFSGDGGIATSAELHFPTSLALDGSGNLYIADNNNFRIREISKSTLQINTIAGNGTSGFSGDGGAATSAELAAVGAVSVDDSGNVYIADAGNNRIRRVNKSNSVIYTVAGDGTAGFSGDGGPATSAAIHTPSGVIKDAAGAVYIGDFTNNRVRKISGPLGINELSTSVDMNVYPNPGNGQFTVTMDNGQSAIGNCTLSIYDILGKEVYTQTLNEVSQHKSIVVNVSGIPTGLYIMQLKSPKGTVSKRLVVQK